MTTYVLVHGAWSGAHEFRKVRRLLREAGHEVFTPSLTGLGERVHLTSPQVNLTTHITDVANTILYEDLTDIVLLGFSYGGMVVTGSLDHIGERVRHLVYLDAFVPGDGDSVDGITGSSGPARIEIGQRWLIQPADREFADPADAAWSPQRRTAHPAASFSETVRVRRPVDDYPFTRTYIKATDDLPVGKGPFWAAADRAKSDDGWQYREVDTNHMVATNKPRELADLLLELA